MHFGGKFLLLEGLFGPVLRPIFPLLPFLLDVNALSEVECDLGGLGVYSLSFRNPANGIVVGLVVGVSEVVQKGGFVVVEGACEFKEDGAIFVSGILSVNLHAPHKY